MKSKLLSIMVTCLIFVSPSYAQENLFEGVIRIAASTDFDQMTRDINNINSGKKLVDIIAKSVVKLDGINETFATVNGQFEVLMKVKGNKLVSFNTQDGSMQLFDCGKGEIISTYPFAKVALKYTIAEYLQIMTRSTFDVKIMDKNTQNLAGYKCNNAIVSTKVNGKETGFSEYWYTDSIALPPCYLEIFHRPGLAIVEETKILDQTLYLLVTEIKRIDVSNENFMIPEDYEIFTPKDNMRFIKKLNNAAKNKKSYKIGSKIPEVFWDF